MLGRKNKKKEFKELFEEIKPELDNLLEALKNKIEEFNSSEEKILEELNEVKLGIEGNKETNESRVTIVGTNRAVVISLMNLIDGILEKTTITPEQIEIAVGRVLEDFDDEEE